MCVIALKVQTLPNMVAVLEKDFWLDFYALFSFKLLSLGAWRKSANPQFSVFGITDEAMAVKKKK